MAQRILPRREAGPGPPTRNNAPREATKGCGRSCTGHLTLQPVSRMPLRHGHGRQEPGSAGPPGRAPARPRPDSGLQRAEKLRAQAQGRQGIFGCGGGSQGGASQPVLCSGLVTWGKAFRGPCNLRREATAGGKHCSWDESGNEVALGTLGRGRLELGRQGRLAGRGCIRAAGREGEGGGARCAEAKSSLGPDRGENACLRKPEEERAVGRRGEEGGPAQAPTPCCLSRALSPGLR